MNGIRTDECSEDVIMDVMEQLLENCREPEKVEERVYTYDELLDEVYPEQKNESSGVFEATVSQDAAKIEKAAASAATASKKAITQKRQKNGKEFINAVVVVAVMIALAILLYFLFGDQINEALNPDEVVNFIPTSIKTTTIFDLLS